MVSDGAGKCGCSLARHVYRSQKSVPVARDGFDITWTLRGIAQREPQLGHRFVEAAVEIHEGVDRPQSLAQFFPRHHFASMLCQQGENVKRLFLQFDSNAALAQLAGPQVNLKNAETTSLFATFSGLHRTPPLAFGSSVARVLGGFNTVLPTSFW